MRLSTVSPEKKRVFVFDCDGTVLNTEVYFLSAHHRFTRELRLDDADFLEKFDNALDPTKDGRFFYTKYLAGTGPQDKCDFFNDYFKPKVPFTLKEMELADIKANSYVVDRVCRDSILPGRKELLEYCFQNPNCSIYMVTSSLEHKIRKNLHDSGLERYFGYEGEANLYSYGMYQDKASAINEIMQKEKVSSDQVMYFEDSVKGVGSGSRVAHTPTKHIKIVGCVDGSHCYMGYDELLKNSGATDILYPGDSILSKAKIFLDSSPITNGFSLVFAKECADESRAF